MPPPTTTQVIPGAHVNIVLKADQPTGRTVSGKIQDVLTRGNHPRGIKVRLVDGRVGRVQSMLSSSSSPAANANSTNPSEEMTGNGTGNDAEEGGEGGSGSGLGQDGDRDSWGNSRGRGRGRGRGRASGPRGRGNDYDDGMGGGYPPEQQALGLDAYIKPARNQRRRSGRGRAARSRSTTAAGDNSNGDESSGVRQETASQLSVCPVCGDFEGDEAAVAYHVAGHFGD